MVSLSEFYMIFKYSIYYRYIQYILRKTTLIRVFYKFIEQLLQNILLLELLEGGYKRLCEDLCEFFREELREHSVKERRKDSGVKHKGSKRY